MISFDSAKEVYEAGYAIRLYGGSDAREYWRFGEKDYRLAGEALKRFRDIPHTEIILDGNQIRVKEARFLTESEY